MEHYIPFIFSYFTLVLIYLVYVWSMYAQWQNVHNVNEEMYKTALAFPFFIEIIISIKKNISMHTYRRRHKQKREKKN